MDTTSCCLWSVNFHLAVKQFALFETPAKVGRNSSGATSMRRILIAIALIALVVLVLSGTAAAHPVVRFAVQSLPHDTADGLR